MPATVTSSPPPRPPFPWLADYRCQSADAELPPVRLPNPCRLRRHPLSGELPASRPVAPVIVLPLLMLMQMVLMAMVVILCACSSRCVGILLYVILALVLLAVFYYIGIRHTAIIVLYRILRLLIIPALRRNFPSVVCEGRCKPSVVEHSLRATASVQCEGTKAVSCGRSGGNKAAKTTLLG